MDEWFCLDALGKMRLERNDWENIVLKNFAYTKKKPNCCWFSKQQKNKLGTLKVMSEIHILVRNGLFFGEK